ncbi:MAG: hypothetical protein GC138_01685 [Gammaproteobacteria bacterium]|nr:hypothetical protein [Gammaproteobacteria bacterium]
MGVYSVDKLIAEARKLAADYYRATGKPLAGVSGEVCLHDAIRLLDLEASQEPGYDAVGKGPRAGKRIQIKGRTIFDEAKSGHRIGQFRMDQDWDLVLLVLMDADLEPFEIYEADRDEICEALDTAPKNRRGAMTVARFRRIGRMVWNREEGVVADEVWDNQASTV